MERRVEVVDQWQGSKGFHKCRRDRESYNAMHFLMFLAAFANPDKSDNLIFCGPVICNFHVLSFSLGAQHLNKSIL